LEEQYGFEKVISFILVIVLVSCAHGPKVVFDNGASFTVELARSEQEKEQGLMFRSSLPASAGMLFVFDGERPRSFWMKNTKISLDMIYVAKNLSVVEVKENVPSCVKDPCQVYESVPAMFVLEVNAGEAKKSGIDVGSKMSLRE